MAAATAEVSAANVALTAAQVATPTDQVAIDAASARYDVAVNAATAANALPADPDQASDHAQALADLNTMDVDKADIAAHAAAVVAATEIHNVALELNSAIVGNQPQAARSLRARYDELLAKLEGK